MTAQSHCSFCWSNKSILGVGEHLLWRFASISVTFFHQRWDWDLALPHLTHTSPSHCLLLQRLSAGVTLSLSGPFFTFSRGATGTLLGVTSCQQGRTEGLCSKMFHTWENAFPVKLPKLHLFTYIVHCDHYAQSAPWESFLFSSFYLTFLIPALDMASYCWRWSNFSPPKQY